MPTTRIELPNELGIFSAAAIREQLLAALEQADTVDVDLSRVTETDSAGMQLLVAAQAEATARGKRLRFVAHSPAVLDILELCDLAARFDVPAAPGLTP